MFAKKKAQLRKLEQLVYAKQIRETLPFWVQSSLGNDFSHKNIVFLFFGSIENKHAQRFKIQY